MLEACALMGQRQVRYHIRVSRRARRLSVSVRPDAGVVVTAPERASRASVDAFLHSQQRWILRHLDRFAVLAAKLPRPWPYGRTLPYQGRQLTVVMRPASARSVRLGEVSLDVALPNATEEAARRLLKRWYLQEAGRQFGQAVQRWAQSLGVDWRALTIGQGRSRWGSCSAAGRLRLNYRLVMAPPKILDYVVIHELAHRKEMNHSPRFWAVVSRFAPDHRESRRWLRTYGPYLGV